MYFTLSPVSTITILGVLSMILLWVGPTNMIERNMYMLLTLSIGSLSHKTGTKYFLTPILPSY